MQTKWMEKKEMLYCVYMSKFHFNHDEYGRILIMCLGYKHVLV